MLLAQVTSAAGVIPTAPPATPRPTTPAAIDIVSEMGTAAVSVTMAATAAPTTATTAPTAGAVTAPASTAAGAAAPTTAVAIAGAAIAFIATAPTTIATTHPTYAFAFFVAATEAKIPPFPGPATLAYTSAPETISAAIAAT